MFAGGPVVSGSKDARLIVIRPAVRLQSQLVWFQLVWFQLVCSSSVGSVAGPPGTSVS